MKYTSKEKQIGRKRLHKRVECSFELNEYRGDYTVFKT